MTPTVSTKQKKRPLSLIVLLAMLILAPLGSWIYLKLGIDYRKQYLEELKPKTLDANVSQEIMPILKKNGKIKLVHINQLNDDAQEVLDNLDERIVDKTYLDLISLAEAPVKAADEKKSSALLYYPTVGEVNYQSSFLLFDTSNVFRAEYKMSDEVGKELIRHLAVMIPIPKQKNEVQLKRDVEKK